MLFGSKTLSFVVMKYLLPEEVVGIIDEVVGEFETGYPAVYFDNPDLEANTAIGEVEVM
jgi:hypothetical protein